MTAQHAFGLELTGDLAIAGASSAPISPNGHRCALDVLPRAEVDRDVRGRSSQRLREERRPDGRPWFTIDEVDGAGFRLWATGHGCYVIRPDGSRVLAAPPKAPVWRWQRLVIAQVLPLTALIQGLEVLHSSAVVVDGAAFAVIGPSGVGKTSTAVQLVRRGLHLLTDDVLAVEARDGDVYAYPGAGPTRVHHHEWRAIPLDERRGMGEVVARSDKTHLALSLHPNGVPLRGVYYLQRSDGESLQIEERSPPDPFRLLGSTFIHYYRPPRRLRRQLEMCERLAARARMFDVSVVPGFDSAAVASRLHEHAATVAEGA